MERACAHNVSSFTHIANRYILSKRTWPRAIGPFLCVLRTCVCAANLEHVLFLGHHMQAYAHLNGALNKLSLLYKF